jgi:hypothetical protein
MKLNKIQALVLTLGVALSSGAMFTGKANAQAISTASFTGNVAQAAAIATGGAFTAADYLPTVLPGASGGPTSFSAVITGTNFFDTNGDTASASLSVITTRPIPANATALVAQHSLVYQTIGTTTSAASAPQQTTSGTTLATEPAVDILVAAFPTDVNGDVGFILTSSWAGGEDLFVGAYTADVVVTVTGL